ncbi:MAG: hypothetical protein A3F70_09975 [Acidobacteria bacterium RIFCSPLOWO2_12_FULL_67_14]|nr:MAG: hypothetical protein A3F70_09975 [Acidobacteria bacterium RIFCSPLOWO2_12_FULL_67_14]
MMTSTVLAAFAWWAFLICAVYLVALTVLLLAMLVVAVRENRLRADEARLDDFATVRHSPFTIPVSIIAPAYNEEACISASISSLLALDYPEYEVIVVNDGSRDGTFQELRRRFELEPVEVYPADSLPTSEIRQVYRSRQHPRLTVVDKDNGGKADALNCGVNLARFRYVCCVDADTVYYPHALLSGMRHIVQDPQHVVGVTSQIALSRHPERTPRTERLRIDRHPMLVFQTFDYLRAFAAARLAWSRWNYMLCSVGAFAIWRRDIVSELGGFSTSFTCEDIEFTFRVHEHFRSTGTPYAVLSLTDIVGVTEGPQSVGGLVSQRARWQRVIAETVWRYRRMFWNPTYGAVGFAGMTYYVVAEVLAPLFQILAIVAVPAGAVAGVIAWPDFWRVLATVAIVNGMFTIAAMLLQQRAFKTFSAADLRYMIALGPLELLLYRPFIMFAQVKGTIDFLLRDRRWNKFERNPRGGVFSPVSASRGLGLLEQRSLPENALPLQ